MFSKVEGGTPCGTAESDAIFLGEQGKELQADVRWIHLPPLMVSVVDEQRKD